MHGHRGFSRARHPLHNHIVIGGFSDNLILLLLNGGNDFSQNRLLVFGQILCKKLVVGNYLAVKKIQQLSAFNFISTLARQINRNIHIPRRPVAAFSQIVFVICVCHRRAPVHHRLMGGVPCYAAPADIKRLLLTGFFIAENDSAKVGLVFCLFIAHKRPLHVLVHRDRVV